MVRGSDLISFSTYVCIVLNHQSFEMLLFLCYILFSMRDLNICGFCYLGEVLKLIYYKYQEEYIYIYVFLSSPNKETPYPLAVIYFPSNI